MLYLPGNKTCQRIRIPIDDDDSQCNDLFNFLKKTTYLAGKEEVDDVAKLILTVTNPNPNPNQALTVLQI